MRIITDERCAGYSHPGHPERPERYHRNLAEASQPDRLPITWSARPCDEAAILRAHTPEHLARLAGWRISIQDTPFYPTSPITPGPPSAQHWTL